ncbi:MAG: ATP-dependent chaperone ClpB, partial [Acidimicrobiia bacterium]
MQPERLTSAAQRAISQAVALATERDHQFVEPAHLGRALLAETDGLVYPLLQALSIDPTRLRGALDEILDGLPKVYGGERTLSPATAATLEAAERLRTRLGDDYLSVEHLALALADGDEPTGRALAGLGATPDALEGALERVRGSRRVTSSDPEATQDALDKYGRDLTADARAGRLDPVIGRDDEIGRVIQVLSRRTKNNPVLLGEAGVGKTAIVEGLAQR